MKENKLDYYSFDGNLVKMKNKKIIDFSMGFLFVLMFFSPLGMITFIFDIFYDFYLAILFVIFVFYLYSLIMCKRSRRKYLFLGISWTLPILICVYYFLYLIIINEGGGDKFYFL